MRSKFDSLPRPVTDLLCAHQSVHSRTCRLVPRIRSIDLPGNNVNRRAKSVAAEHGKSILRQICIAVIEAQEHWFFRKADSLLAPTNPISGKNSLITAAGKPPNMLLESLGRDRQARGSSRLGRTDMVVEQHRQARGEFALKD